jgi:hypothetical protein
MQANIDRISEFNKNRTAVLEEHLRRSPTIRAARRKRAFTVGLAVLRAGVTTLAVLALIKSLMLATTNQTEYARIISPAMEHVGQDNPLRMALLPDSLTLSVADALRPYLPQSAPDDLAYGPPPPPQATAPDQ